jgi:hypothetical protein
LLLIKKTNTNQPHKQQIEPQDKKKKQEDRMKQKASRSRLLKDLKDEFSEQPDTYVYVRKTQKLLLSFRFHFNLNFVLLQREELEEYDRRQQEKEAHEEEYFVRLPVTREDKKKAKKKFVNELTVTTRNIAVF